MGAIPRGDAPLPNADWTNGLHIKLKTGSFDVTWTFGRVVAHLALSCLCLKVRWQVSHLKCRTVAFPSWLLTSLLSSSAFLLFLISSSCILFFVSSTNTPSFPPTFPFNFPTLYQLPSSIPNFFRSYLFVSLHPSKINCHIIY